MLNNQITIRLSKELIDDIDKVIKKGYFKYRSEYIRYSIIKSNKAFKEKNKLETF